MIALGCDHGGYKLKEEIKKYLEENEMSYKDFGTMNEERTDYPIFAEAVAKSIQSKECDKGILICKTGVGMVLVANKFKGIRCAVCSDEMVAKQAKEHSNINILALPAEYVSITRAVPIIRMWLAAEFQEGRYAHRLQMIKDIEKENMK